MNFTSSWTRFGIHRMPKTFRGSSVVERLAVNELVVGSNPTRGAS
jgi:hypothetical protein